MIIMMMMIKQKQALTLAQTVRFEHGEKRNTQLQQQKALAINKFPDPNSRLQQQKITMIVTTKICMRYVSTNALSNLLQSMSSIWPLRLVQ